MAHVVPINYANASPFPRLDEQMCVWAGLVGKNRDSAGTQVLISAVIARLYRRGEIILDRRTLRQINADDRVPIVYWRRNIRVELTVTSCHEQV